MFDMTSLHVTANDGSLTHKVIAVAVSIFVLFESGVFEHKLNRILLGPTDENSDAASVCDLLHLIDIVLRQFLSGHEQDTARVVIFGADLTPLERHYGILYVRQDEVFGERVSELSVGSKDNLDKTACCNTASRFQSMLLDQRLKGLAGTRFKLLAHGFNASTFFLYVKIAVVDGMKSGEHLYSER